MNIKDKYLLLSLFAMLILAAISSTASLADSKKEAEQPHDTLFILDASGSMWGQINGKPKIAIAKEVMKKLVPELSPDNRIGLMAYGHRRKGDCSDVQTLVKPGKHHQQAILKAVNGLSAKGKTPLTRSVNQAFDMLRPAQNTSTIVLVSDGIESCHGDPCAAVKMAKAAGINFILHTIGFGVSAGESAQLRCMAKAGDGQYFQANSADALLKSTRKAIKAKAPGELILTLSSNGKPVKAWVRLSGKGSIGLVEYTNDQGVNAGHHWRLQPGVYRLETRPAGLHGVEPLVISGIKITAGKTVTKRLTFSQSTLHLSAFENGNPAIVQISLKNLASGKTVFDTSSYSTFTMRGVKTPYDIKVAPGKYRLSVKLPTEITRSDLAPYQKDIDLSSDKSSLFNKTVRFITRPLRITALIDGKPARAHLYIDDLTANRNLFNSDFLVSGGFQTPYQLILTPGRYRLTARVDGVENPQTETLKIADGGKVLDKTFRFKRQKIKTTATGMEMDTDRPWNDFSDFVPKANDPALCQTACKQDARCKAWTYVRRGAQGRTQPHCYLKSPVPDAHHDSCCISGVVR